MPTPYESYYEEIKEKDRQFSAILFKLSNAVLVFFYDGGSMKLGTLSIALPQFGGKTCISSILLGERNMIITKILAERFSSAFRGMALVSTHLTDINNDEDGSTLLKLADQLLQKTIRK